MTQARQVADIPLERIEVLNPRDRNRRVFQELVSSIQALGLKKPITVTPRPGPEGERYLLVCGQGRLEAFQALGQSTIPALLVDVIGFYPDGRPGEVFTHGARSGSSMDALLADACVVVSSLMQHGAEPGDLSSSMGRLGNAEPASIIGAVIDMVAASASHSRNFAAEAGI